MNPTPLTLVCFAVKQEAFLFSPLASGRAGLKALVTGMGKAECGEIDPIIFWRKRLQAGS